MTAMTLEEAMVTELGGYKTSNDMRVVMLPAAKIIHSSLHKFTPDQNRITELAESIREHGLLQPIVVRDSEDTPGNYELLAGYHRLSACEAIGMELIPAMIRNVDDDRAIDIIIYTNLQSGLEQRRKTEVGKSFKLRNDLQKHQGVQRKDGVALSKLMEEEGWGATKIRRYIRFAYLTDALGTQLDKGALSDYAAEKLSFLTTEHQDLCADIMEFYQKTLTRAQAGEIKEKESCVEDFELFVRQFFENPKKLKPVKVDTAKLIDFLPKTLDITDQTSVMEYVAVALDFYKNYGYPNSTSGEVEFSI